MEAGASIRVSRRHDISGTPGIRCPSPLRGRPYADADFYGLERHRMGRVRGTSGRWGPHTVARAGELPHRLVVLPVRERTSATGADPAGLGIVGGQPPRRGTAHHAWNGTAYTKGIRRVATTATIRRNGAGIGVVATRANKCRSFAALRTTVRNHFSALPSASLRAGRTTASFPTARRASLRAGGREAARARAHRQPDRA